MEARGPGSPGDAERPRAGKQGLVIAAVGVALATGIAALTFASHVPGVAARISRASSAGTEGSRSSARRVPSRAIEYPIVFASRKAGRYHLHLINSDGTGETQLTSGSGQQRTPAWSPGRDRIAFAGSRVAGDSAEMDSYIVRVDGTGLIRLTHGPRNDEDPSWSPDGTRIVYTSSDRSTGRTRIRIANVDGSKSVQLPPPPVGCIDREPAWSPDGRTIAFARQCGAESSRLYLIHADGTGLLEVAGFGRTPAWSPDGTKLAFTGWGKEGPAVCIINADGTGKTQLTTDGTGDPTWSPDGSRMAFIVNEVLVLKLFVVNLDGSDQRPLTEASTNEVMPSW